MNNDENDPHSGCNNFKLLIVALGSNLIKNK